MQALPGSYVLILRADRHAPVPVGRLGTLALRPGWYAYAGSALGPGGVRARVLRHRRGSPRRHWHVDWLRAVTTPVAAWVGYGPARREHAWAAVLHGELGGAPALPRFGASDCACVAHCFYFAALPAWQRLAQAGDDEVEVVWFGR